MLFFFGCSENSVLTYHAHTSWHYHNTPVVAYFDSRRHHYPPDRRAGVLLGRDNSRTKKKRVSHNCLKSTHRAATHTNRALFCTPHTGERACVCVFRRLKEFGSRCAITSNRTAPPLPKQLFCQFFLLFSGPIIHTLALLLYRTRSRAPALDHGDHDHTQPANKARYCR